MRRAAVVAALLLAAVRPATAAPVVVLTPGTITGAAAYQDATVIVAGTVTVAGSLTLERASILAVPGASLTVPGTLTLIDVAAEGLSVTVSGGDATMTRTVLRRSITDTIAMTGGSLRASDLTIEAAGVVGLRVAGATVDADGLHVRGANGYGIRVADSAFTAGELTVTTATDYGFFAERSSIDVTGVAFDGHCGMYLASGTTGSVRDGSFATADHGLTLYRSGLVAVRGVRFDGGSAGLTAVGAPVDVAGITASGVQRGIVTFDAGGTIDGGRLAASEAAVSAAGAAVPVLRSLDLAASPVGVRNTSTTPVDARWNWWGGAPGALGSAATDGPVTVSPWLSAPPA